MTTKFKIKMLLDLAMTIIMIVLMGYEVSGSFWHEVLGTAVLLMIIIHNLLNIRWFVSIIKSKNKNYKDVLKVIINLLLTVNSIFLLISSLIISKHLFIFLGIIELGSWVYIHRLTAFLEIIMIAVHLGFHWKMILGVFRKIFGIKGKNPVRTFILRALALILAILGVKASFDRDIATSILPDVTEDTYSTSDIATTEVTTIATSYSSESSYNGVTIEDGDTLNDFLGNLYCTACHRHCSLLRPQCNKGVVQASQAEAYFESYTAEVDTEEETTQAATETTTEATSEDSSSDSDSEISSSEIYSEDSTESSIRISLDTTDDSLLNIFTDYIPIMGLYVAGAYYTLEIIDKKKKK